MVTVGKRPGPAMRRLQFRVIQFGYLSDCAAAGCNAIERAVVITSKNNYAIAIPSAAPSIWRVAECLRRTAGRVDFLQFGLREVSDEAAIGRPERIRGILSTSQWLGRKRSQRPNPKQLFSTRRTNDNYDAKTIGRNRKLTARQKAGIFRLVNRRADDVPARRRL